MPQRLRPPLWLLPVLLFPGGCSLSEGYPSLMPRPAERIGFDAPLPARSAPIRQIDSALESQVAGLLEEARRGDGVFQAALPSTREAVGRAGAAGSENWIDAQQRLTVLESLRNPVTAALDQLSTLLVEHQKLDAPPNTDSLEAAIAEASRLDAGEQAEIDRLAGALPQL